jgi:hypothetical protein
MSAETLEQRLLELEERVANLEKMRPSLRTEHVTPPAQKKISAKEFLLTKDLKTEVQKTLVLGYYLEYVEGIASFNTDDLAAVFQSAKEKRPKNMNDAVNRNVARGLLMEVGKKDSKKAWILTTTGEKYVEGELNK